MTASELAHILRARRQGRRWVARCPVHGAGRGDSSPSLCVDEWNGRVGLRCWAGCSERDILSTLGLTFHDLGYNSEPDWKKRIQTKNVRAPGKRPSLGDPIAIYRYTDERGELIAEKLRFAPKTFLWRRPQAGGGWVWKVDRDSLPLYRLHEIVKAQTVCICEGEKDADRLATFHGRCAVTTAPNGAKSWRAEFGRYFQGKAVYIFPDNDAPGVAYAHRIAVEILRAAKRVQIVYLPCKDLSIYLDSHSVEELKDLMRGIRGKAAK